MCHLCPRIKADSRQTDVSAFCVTFLADLRCGATERPRQYYRGTTNM